MRPEALPWLRQAGADLQAARDSLAMGHHEWACFQTQQSAEKALKAFLWESLGHPPPRMHTLFDPAGQSLLGLCEELNPVFSTLVAEVALLHRHESSTRYPDALTDAPDVAPADFFKQEDAERSIRAATAVLDMVRGMVGA